MSINNDSNYMEYGTCTIVSLSGKNVHQDQLQVIRLQ